MKIISFSQQGPRAICILSANGVISNVTLRQPDSSGGTLTYEVSENLSRMVFIWLNNLLISDLPYCHLSYLNFLFNVT